MDAPSARSCCQQLTFMRKGSRPVGCPTSLFSASTRPSASGWCSSHASRDKVPLAAAAGVVAGMMLAPLGWVPTLRNKKTCSDRTRCCSGDCICETRWTAVDAHVLRCWIVLRVVCLIVCTAHAHLCHDCNAHTSWCDAQAGARLACKACLTPPYTVRRRASTQHAASAVQHNVLVSPQLCKHLICLWTVCPLNSIGTSQLQHLAQTMPMVVVPCSRADVHAVLCQDCQ